MSDKMTSDELQEVLSLLENFTVTSGLNSHKGKHFSWKDIIQALRDRIAELEEEVKKGHTNEKLQAREIERLQKRVTELETELEAEIQKHLIFLRKIHYDQMFNVCMQYTPPTEGKKAEDER